MSPGSRRSAPRSANSDPPYLSMKRNIHLLSALLLAAPAVALLRHGDPERVVFGPAAGSKLTKTFVNSMDLELDDMSMLMNGEPAPFMDNMEMHMKSTATITVTDTYSELGEGRPKKLLRAFDEIGTDIEMDMSVEVMGQAQEQSPTGTGTSKLTGKTVQFELADEAYQTSFPEGEEGDPELLKGLVEDMDLRVMLPGSGSASVGDSWDIDLHGLVDVLAPGGDLKMDIEMEGDDMMGAGVDPSMGSNLREYFGEMIDGSAKGTLTEVREAGDARVAVIDLAIEIDTSADMSEFMMEQMGEQVPEGIEVSLSRADVEFELELKGQLLWNLTAGHVHGLELEGTSTVASDVEMNMDAGGQAMDMEMSMEMSGAMAVSVKTQ